jgi:hypothetical protein
LKNFPNGEDTCRDRFLVPADADDFHSDTRSGESFRGIFRSNRARGAESGMGGNKNAPCMEKRSFAIITAEQRDDPAVPLFSLNKVPWIISASVSLY